MSTGTTTKESVKSNMYHNLRVPARTVDIVSALKRNVLMSTGKFAGANYIIVMTRKELLIYDGNEV